MDSMAAQKDSDFCVKEEPRMAVEDLVQLFIDRDTLAKYEQYLFMPLVFHISCC